MQRNSFFKNLRRSLAALSSLVPALPSMLFAAERVEIRLDLPAEAQTFSGTQPFILGIPFPDGKLAVGEGLRLVDEEGKTLPGQFEVTATWRPDGKGVRWLLVDGLVPVREGTCPRVYLEFGPDVPVQAAASAFKIGQSAEQISVDTGGRRYVFDGTGGNVGQFLFKDGEGIQYAAGENDPTWKMEIEKEGPVRCVVKMTGVYRDGSGKLLAEHVSRFRLYAGQSYARVFHTFIWQTDDQTEIGQVAFRAAPLAEAGKVAAGLDGQSAEAADSQPLMLRQISANEVSGTRNGRRLDGWIQQEAKTESVFAALRWPWQQFPTAVEAGEKGGIVVGFLHPEKSFSLRAQDVVVPEALTRMDQWNCTVFDVSKNFKVARVTTAGENTLPILSPRGVARTWEMVLWHDGNPAAAAPPVKNALAQHGLLAHADPAFVTQAGLPSPMSPKDEKTFPEVEGALDRAFGWYARELDAEHDYGALNFGDIQFQFTERGGDPIYRYWMNHGKGWSILPWILWMRSGDRKYFENALANSRHCMDVDMCHVPEWEPAPPDYHVRGGHYSYDVLHWGFGPSLYNFWTDSEYLPYAYYLTGDERARDCLLLHAEALARFQGLETLEAWYESDLPRTAGRSLYEMVKNLGVLYEATWDKRLGDALAKFAELERRVQDAKGNLPGDVSNHYVDQGMNIAARILGWDTMKDTIKKWYDFHGSPLHPGPSGGIDGPFSLWSAINLFEHGQGERYLQDASAMLKTQSSTVVKSDDEWNGLNSVPAHAAGPALRDWVIAMAALKKIPEANWPSSYLPMEAFASLAAPGAFDQAEGFLDRHVAYVLDNDGGGFRLNVYFARPTTQKLRLRVHAPDGKMIVSSDASFAAKAKGKPSSKEIKFNRDKDLVFFDIPAEGQKGAFAIELLTQTEGGQPMPFALKSSTGKVVHCLPLAKGNFFSQSPHSGQFWFQPAADAASVGLSNPFVSERDDAFIGVTRILDADGRELASSRVTGSEPFTPPRKSRVVTAALPVGTSCSFTPGEPARRQILSAVLPSNFYERWEWKLTGMKPWISATKDEWFDPESYPSLPLQQLMDQPPAAPAVP